MIRSKYFKSQKGQAAIEFLATYGWAILVVAVIMAILYSSIFKPEFYVAERCDIAPGITCSKFYLTKTNQGLNLTVHMYNSFGFNANITQVNFTLKDRINNKEYMKSASGFPIIVNNGESFNASVLFNVGDTSEIPSGTLYSIYFRIGFKNSDLPSAPMHYTSGIINVRVA